MNHAPFSVFHVLIFNILMLEPVNKRGSPTGREFFSLFLLSQIRAIENIFLAICVSTADGRMFVVFNFHGGKDDITRPPPPRHG